MAIVWTSDWETGIAVIDSQHKQIFDYINELDEAMKLHNRDAVGHVLDELTDYTVSHFAFEENLLTEAHYEFLDSHKVIHDTFIKRISTYKNDHAAGKDVSEQLYDMVSTWLYHHIKRDDMAYVHAVKDRIENLVENKNEGGWFKRSIGAFFR
ncbi:MAG: bacteriohemerythrin [Gallionella sp.]|nr:bacteriohemerythrin [Gallionella sp.]MDD4959266.1 bacteriohemerythrin [Gallionella sp.]